MSRSGRHAKHAGRDLWGRRPLSGWPHCSLHKRICRRLERRAARNAVRLAWERGEELP